MQKICSTKLVLSDKQKERCVGDNKGDARGHYHQPVTKGGSKVMIHRPRDCPTEASWFLQTWKGKAKHIHWENSWWPPLFFFYSKGIIYICWVPSALIINKEYCEEVLKEPRKSLCCPNRSSSTYWHWWHHHQCTIWSWLPATWQRWASKLPLTFPTVQTLLVVIFGSSPSWRRISSVVSLKTWEKWRGLW